MRRNRCLVFGVWCQVIALCYLFFIFSMVGCAKKKVKNIDSKGKNIVCFGDSLTFGYGAEPNEAYPEVLSKMINIPVINAGIDGDTSVEGLKRLETDVLGREPLLVIIEFGGNDFLRKIPPETTIKNVETMIISAQSKGAMVAIADISLSVIMDAYAKEFRRLAKKYNAIFIPQLLNGILTRPSLKSDFIHPNAEGYKIIAQRVYQAMPPFLKQNGLSKATN